MKLIKHTLIFLMLGHGAMNGGELAAERIPAEAKWVLHADVEAMRASETGRRIFQQIEADHGDQLRAFKRMFSVHPIEDLNGVTLFGDGTPDRAVVLLQGKFDRAHVEDVVRGAEDHSTAEHAGVTVHTWRDQGVMQHAGFAADDLLVFSRQDRALLKSLEVLNTGAAAATQDAVLAAPGAAALLDVRARLGDIPLPADAAKLLRRVSGLRISAVEADGRLALRMAMETGNEGDADRMRRVLDGIYAFAEMEHPELIEMDLRGEMAKPEGFTGVSAGVSLPVGNWIRVMEKLAGK